jgi:hypothetical protein
MTFGLYSGGVSLAVKRDALEKLQYRPILSASNLREIGP